MWRTSVTREALAEHGAVLADALLELAEDESNHEDLLEEGVPVLVGLLRAGPEAEATSYAVGALFELSRAGGRAARLLRPVAVAPAVALLRAMATSPTDTTADAAKLLSNIAMLPEGQRAVAAAGAVPPLVMLLRARPDVAGPAANTLGNLACDHDVNRSRIIDAGAVPLLVPLLRDETSTKGASVLARNLACHAEGPQHLHAAGATAPLVAVLHDANAETAANAAAALDILCDDAHEEEACTALLAALAARPPPPPSKAEPELGKILGKMLKRMREVALPRLAAAEAGDDADALEEAVEQAAAVRAPAATLKRAHVRLAALRERAEAVRRERRASLGLDELPTPAEFKCPLELGVMKDPVVASDGRARGHTYERVAIERVLGFEEERRVSPMTREPLQASLYANIALRQRIQAYSADVEAMAERVARRLTDRFNAAVERGKQRRAQGGVVPARQVSSKAVEGRGGGAAAQAARGKRPASAAADGAAGAASGRPKRACKR